VEAFVRQVVVLAGVVERLLDGGRLRLLFGFLAFLGALLALVGQGLLEVVQLRSERIDDRLERVVREVHVGVPGLGGGPNVRAALAVVPERVDQFARALILDRYLRRGWTLRLRNGMSAVRHRFTCRPSSRRNRRDQDS